MGKLAKYSTMVIQMGLSVLIGVYAGQWLDEKMKNATPWLTIVCIFIALGGSFYQVYRQLQADNT